MEPSQILSSLREHNEEIAELTAQKKQLQKLLLESLKPQIDEQLQDKDYNCGTANVVVGNHQVSITIPKKIKYDNEELNDLYQEIRSHGDDPEEFINVKFSINENAFKLWPVQRQNYFARARTVDRGAPVIKVKDK